MTEGLMNELVLGVGACIFLIFFLFTGIEIAFGILMVGLVGYALLYDFDAAYNLMVQDFFDVLSSYSLTVIPLFMLMGQIAFNAGKEGAVIVQKVIEGTGDFGYNARTDVFENLYEAGVIDPAKVTRIALENAASIAGMFLTTECVLVDEKEEKSAMPPMGGGMGGGMGGMM